MEFLFTNVQGERIIIRHYRDTVNICIHITLYTK